VGQTEFLKLAAEGNKQQAGNLLLTTVIRDQEIYFNQVKALIELVGTLLDMGGQDAADNFLSGRNLMAALATLATLLACALAYWATRSITLPLTRAVQVARTVASGDLTSRIEVSSNDETGQLLQALQDMNQSLLRIVGEVHNGSDTIASASSQIAAGNLDLSSRTEEQASSLEQTASSMEELTSTVKQNADNARHAYGLALAASQVATKGGAVVSQVVDTMVSINHSSKKIADIIGVIDSIAFQTNILALNAAVEAARAGEQGRGFAVVATEVRNLAHRSADAAHEIKSLIGDSLEKVALGAQLVSQAGSTMQDVVDSVKRVTDVMNEITAASQEQTTGIEQVNQAIIQMDHVTQQNAALVEQAAAAAAALQDQAAHLVHVVSVFKLDASTAPAPAPARLASRTASPASSARRAAPVLAAADAQWEQF
jgi:methyl-accepting chemotaxis protein